MHRKLLGFSLGCFSGSLGSVCGIGGSAVNIPFLTTFFKLTQHQAHGTTLASTLATGLIGSASFYLYEGINAVDIPSAALMSGVAMILAPRFGRLAQNVSQKNLLIILSTIQASSIPLFFLKYRSAEKPLQDQQYQSLATKSIGSALILTTIGLFTGAASGIFGVGGGIAMVPLLSLFSGNHQLAIGTSLCAMVAPTLVSTATHWKLGNVDRRLAIPLFIGSGLTHLMTFAHAYRNWSILGFQECNLYGHTPTSDGFFCINDFSYHPKRASHSCYQKLAT